MEYHFWRGEKYLAKKNKIKKKHVLRMKQKFNSCVEKDIKMVEGYWLKSNSRLHEEKKKVSYN